MSTDDDLELGLGTAIDLPVEHVRARRPRRPWRGDMFALVGGAVVAGIGWLGRRAYVAMPAVALTIAPLMNEPLVEASEPLASETTSVHELAPDEASLPQGVLIKELSMEEEPLIQSPRTKPKKPARQPTGPSVPTVPGKQKVQAVVVNAPSIEQLADLYRRTGRALKDAGDVNRNATLDLWPRYRWVNFMDAIKTPEKRAEAAAVLEKLLAETKKLAP